MATASTCPYCHQTKFDASVGLLPSGLSLEDEVNFLDAEARRLELLIPQIHAKRKALFTRLNTIRSITGALPPEVLSLVFQEFCAYYPRKNRKLCVGSEEEHEDDEDGKGEDGRGDRALRVSGQTRWYNIRLALRLGSVSSQWRDVAHSTPQLWSTFHSKPFADANVRNDSSFISLALERSRTLPLRLDFDFDVIWRRTIESSELFDPSVDERINESLSRVEELSLVYPSNKWLEVGPQLSQLSKLAMVTFDIDSKMENSELRLSNSPSLRSLTLVSPLTRIRLPSMCNITILNLRRTHPDTCIQLLLECPRLVVFRAIPRQREITNPMPPTRTCNVPITFEDLRVFNWLGHLDAWDRNCLMQSIHLPAIVELSLYTMDSIPSALEEFSSKLPPTLRSLSFGSFGFDYLLDTKFQELMSLALVHCGKEFVLTTMYRLGESVDGEFLLFPRLKKITLNGPKLTSAFFEGLAGMCERRVERGTSLSLNLELGPSGLKWPDIAQRRLMKLRPALTVTVNRKVCFPASLDTPVI